MAEEDNKGIHDQYPPDVDKEAFDRTIAIMMASPIIANLEDLKRVAGEDWSKAIFQEFYDQATGAKTAPKEFLDSDTGVVVRGEEYADLKGRREAGSELLKLAGRYPTEKKQITHGNVDGRPFKVVLEDDQAEDRMREVVKDVVGRT